MTQSLLLAPEFSGDTAHYWEDTPDGPVIRSVQDVAPVLERALAMRNHNDGYSPSRELRRVAFIPNIIRDKWLAEEGWDAWRPDLYPEKLVQKLNDPDWAYLRTASGRVANTNGVIR